MVVRGRFTEAYVTTCWRKARFSNVRARCVFITESNKAKTAHINEKFILSMLRSGTEKVNHFNRIYFLGRTPYGEPIDLKRLMFDTSVVLVY